MTIYFIEMSRTGAIKIGLTNVSDVTQRMRQLQTGQPEKLRLIGTIEGGAEVERLLHEQFSEFRRNGEWFKGPSSFRWFIGFMCAQKLPWQFMRAYSLLDAWREETLADIQVSRNKDSEINWRDKQITRQHRKLKEQAEKIERLQAELLQANELAVKPSTAEPTDLGFFGFGLLSTAE